MTFANKIDGLRDAVAERRHRSRRRRRLERELADATPAERQDLRTHLRRYPAEETRDIRTMLDRQATRQPLVVGGMRRPDQP
jgi:hypothetical protein